MSEADDMKTIVALLGNLIDRIENIEERQTKIQKHLAAVREHAKEEEGIERRFRKVVLLTLQKLSEKPA